MTSNPTIFEHAIVCSIICRHPRSRLFPYTTLFRSDGAQELLGQLAGALGVDEPDDRQDEQPLIGLIDAQRSEEHTSELQSLRQLVCRLLLEKTNRDRRVMPAHARRLRGLTGSCGGP